MRPSTMTSIRSGMPPTPRRPPGPPPAPHTPNTLDLFMAQRGAFPAATPSAKADASATYEDAHEDAEEVRRNSTRCHSHKLTHGRTIG